jgi:predicted dehydrogenase
VTTLRAGLSGCGALGRRIVQQVRTHAHCDIVALHDPDELALARLGNETGIQTRTTSFDALLATGVDFVVLAGPPAARLPQVQAAADQAVHVLLHAPMANDLASGEAMIAAVEAAGVRLGVAVPGQDDPVLEQVRRMLTADWLGGAVCVQGIHGEDDLLVQPPQANDPRLLRRGASHPLLLLAAHHVHLTSWLLGRRAVAVTAQTTQGFLPLPQDGACATAVLRGNVLCTFLASHLCRARAFAVHGTDGGIRLAGDRIWLCGRSAFQGDVFDYPEPAAELSLARSDLANAILALAPERELHGRFAKWIDDCDDFPCQAEQALADLRVLDAMVRAAASGQRETVRT